MTKALPFEHGHCSGREALPGESKSEVAQSCPTLCDPMDCSLQRSSVRGIIQARVLEWVAISFSRGSSQPRDQTWVSHTAGRHFTIWATGSKQEKEYVKAVYCHPAYLTYICRVHHEKCQAEWSTAGIKIAGRNINNLSWCLFGIYSLTVFSWLYQTYL